MPLVDMGDDNQIVLSYFRNLPGFQPAQVIFDRAFAVVVSKREESNQFLEPASVNYYSLM